MKSTNNFNLNKPEPLVNNVDIEVINNNMDTIDTALGDTAFLETVGGTATAITFSNVSFVNGRTKSFIAAADNLGAATTINAKSLYLPGTTNSPTLKAGKAYTIWYNSVNTCFYLKADSGNTIAPVTLSSSSWSGSAAPYSQTVTINGVTASNNCIVSVAQGVSAAQYEAASEAQMIPYSQEANAITIYAYGDKPAINIPISVLILG